MLILHAHSVGIMTVHARLLGVIGCWPLFALCGRTDVECVQGGRRCRRIGGRRVGGRRVGGVFGRVAHTRRVGGSKGKRVGG
jgi:hypothetical protein